MKILNTNLHFKSLPTRNKITSIILHHAAKENCTVEDIHRWHIEDNGWHGIGYHYFIKKNGDIYIGRPENTIGAHCKGHNSNSIGICAEGNFMHEQMNLKQYNSIKTLCINLKDKYSIKNIFLHRDLSNSTCPGINFPTKIKKLKVN